MITRLDDDVGRIVALIDELGRGPTLTLGLREIEVLQRLKSGPNTLPTRHDDSSPPTA